MSNNKHGRSEKWRKAHSQTMRLYQKRLQRGREIAAHKTPTMQVLKKRAAQMARAKLRMKFAGAKGKSYGDLSRGEKIAVDDLVSRNVNSKVIRALTKSLVPRVRQAAAKKKRDHAVTPIVEPHNHTKKKVNEAVNYKALVRGKNTAARTRALRNKFSQKRMDTQMRGANPQTASRSASKALDKPLADIYKQTNDGVSIFSLGRRQQSKHHRKHRTRVSRERSKNKTVQDRARRTARARSTTNRGYGSERDRQMVIRNQVELAINTLQEDAVQDKIESLFIRGLVPKHLIQRYKRVMNDPKRYIKFRQYHDEILTLFRKLQELLTSDDIIFQKVRQQVMANNHGRA